MTIFKILFPLIIMIILICIILYKFIFTDNSSKNDTEESFPMKIKDLGDTDMLETQVPSSDLCRFPTDCLKKYPIDPVYVNYGSRLDKCNCEVAKFNQAP